MKMAKARHDDFETAFLVYRILDAADRGYLFPVDNDDGDEWDELDSDNIKDLRKFFDLLMGEMERNPSGLMRVIGCANTLMSDDNKVVDPDKDYIDFHPRFAAMEKQRDEFLEDIRKARELVNNNRMHTAIGVLDSAIAKAQGVQ